jgi:hypothetical protein
VDNVKRIGLTGHYRTNRSTDSPQYEALPPDILQQLVRDAVEAEVDMDAFVEATELEDAERRQAINAVADLRFDTLEGDIR